MSQRNVEQLIGRLVTDEGLRRRHASDPAGTIRDLLAEGLELNRCEQRALVALDPAAVARFADALDPCILKISLLGDRS